MDPQSRHEGGSHAPVDLSAPMVCNAKCHPVSGYAISCRLSQYGNPFPITDFPALEVRLCRIYELPQYAHLLIEPALGEVHEVVVDDVVVEVLRRDALEMPLHKPFQLRMIGVYRLDVESTRTGLSTSRR